MHGFLKSWFVGLLQGWQDLVETMILVWFYAFDCFGYFWVTDGYFMDLMILEDSLALP